MVTGEMDLAITSVVSGDTFYAVAGTDHDMLSTVDAALKALPIPVGNERGSLMIEQSCCGSTGEGWCVCMSDWK